MLVENDMSNPKCLEMFCFFSILLIFSLRPSNTTVGLKWKVLAKIFEPHSTVLAWARFSSLASPDSPRFELGSPGSPAWFTRFTRLVHPVHLGSPRFTYRFPQVHILLITRKDAFTDIVGGKPKSTKCCSVIVYSKTCLTNRETGVQLWDLNHCFIHKVSSWICMYTQPTHSVTEQPPKSFARHRSTVICAWRTTFEQQDRSS